MYGLPLSPGRAYTWRRFGVLMRGLGADSRFHKALRELNPGDGGDIDTSQWDRTDQILAVIADLLVAANWQRGGGGGKPELLFNRDKPKRSVPKPRLLLSQDEIRRRLSAKGTKGAISG